ncbi:hypothetical protein O4H49_04480 [Kiloniella laminariae]|uniref:PepSY domain-containing protein n=1 Tax=Kiloniella laminariae TaxID=454162 RepID=A0ABT4LI37_9PROT|nr:hypothetical protein [Kiloniella laminariae]MCZ4280021.1 hypothetical protein [Kiloniella laminariae]
MKHMLIAVAFVAAFFVPGFLTAIMGPAQAQTQGRCLTQDAMTARLAQDYHEQLVYTSTSTRGHVVSIFLSPGGETYSVIFTKVNPDGIRVSCLVFAGENWRELPLEKETENEV